ncbi:TB2/DP1/HVA22-related protein, partial [Circinella umbellata]
LYPAYTCFKVIKANDRTQFLPLLMYWVTAMTFIVCEHFADWLLFWIPFYNEVKILIVLWITLPQTKGAIVVYADFIEPILKKHENRID